MPNTELKQTIQATLKAFDGHPLGKATIALLESLGYRSDKRLALTPNTAAQFRTIFDPQSHLNVGKVILSEWQSVDFLFQITDEEIRGAMQGQGQLFAKQKVDNTVIDSYLFFVVGLKGNAYTRTQLATATREINKLFPMPVMVLFHYDTCLTLAIIARRLHKRDPGKDVLEKVTLIKDISTLSPHRAHIEILHDLSVGQLAASYPFSNFVELQRAWEKTLDTSELNKKFYREIADWYFWAVRTVKFPEGGEKDPEKRNSTSVIRLITRLIFVWFIKEKGLVPEDLFDERRLKELLNYSDPKKSTYYKAILQNLFFATLNTEMGEGRRFRGKNKNPNGLDAHHGISTVYRYEEYLKDSKAALRLFASIPFLNGGLFECLDKREEKILVDGFSDDLRNQPVVPDLLFFGEEHTEDLSEIYGDARRNHEKVRGLIHIFNSYKFTIEENTPVEEEIALDPELLGKVFENLLAAYNPETGTTARKQTGSFYTPREIVNYMVDEALIAYLESKLEGANDVQARLRHLLAYNSEPHQFSEDEEQCLIAAIDSIKVLDPACGSGAFPMGILHKLVFILNKLDPGNVHWQEKQIAKASEIPDTTVREHVIADIEQAFSQNELDYGRKLYLIENCIYGVDIQPIAVQIAKLRFFISLVVEQKTDPHKENLGIRPLPNLETRFVAANTLIGIERPQQMMLRNPEIDKKEQALAEVRSSLFTAKTPATKRKYRDLDKKLRMDLADLLKKDGWGSETAAQLAGWDPYNQNDHAVFFDPEWMFGINNGFDIVTGNPPYLEFKKADAKTKELYSGFETAKGKYDVYVLFIEASRSFLNSRGVLCFINPTTFLKKDYGSATRIFIRDRYRIIKIHDFGDFQVFEGATNYTGIFTLTVKNDEEPYCFEYNKYKNIGREIPGDEFSASLGISNTVFKDVMVINSEELMRENWNFLNEISQSLLKKVRDASKPLSEYTQEIFEGIASGKDEVFYINQAVIDEFSLESEIIFPILRGKDIKPYTILWSGYYVIFPYGNDSQPYSESFLSKKYPNVYAYLKKYRNLLEGRGYFDASGKHWFELWNQRKVDNFAKWRIVTPEISSRNSFVLTNKFFGNTKTYHIILKELSMANQYFFLGLLNSKLMDYIYKLISTPHAGGFFAYKTQFLKFLPIINCESEIKKGISDIANRILVMKRTNPEADTYTLEVEIDRLVYDLYGLNEEEIKIVDGG